MPRQTRTARSQNGGETSSTLEGSGDGQRQQAIGEGGGNPPQPPGDDGHASEVRDFVPTLDERLAQARRRRTELVKQRELDAILAQIETLERTAPDPEVAAQARRRLEELQKQQELQETLAQIEALERGEVLPPPATVPPPPSSSGSISHTRGSKRTRSASSDEEEDRGLSIRPAKLSEYHGKTIREHRDWMEECDTVFRQAHRYFKTDKDRILYAMLALRGSPRQLWGSYEKVHRLEQEHHTWEFFSGFLIDLIQNPMNRQIRTSQEIQDAYQRNNQSARRFDQYLKNLEDQLPPMDEFHQGSIFLTKLRPNLRKAVLMTIPVPQKRSELVDLADRLEDVDADKPMKDDSRPPRGREAEGAQLGNRGRRDRSTATGGGPTRDSLPPRSRRDAGGTQANRNDKADITCYNCGERGHIRPNCTKPAANDQRVPVGSVTTLEDYAVEPTGKGHPSSENPRKDKGKQD